MGEEEVEDDFDEDEEEVDNIVVDDECVKYIYDSEQKFSIHDFISQS